jgi:hypothetical protein
MLDAAYTGWLTDTTDGRQVLLVASNGEEASALNQRARLDRITAGQVTALGVELHDGTTAGDGDWVITRRNQRLAATRGGRDFVKNGDRWTLQRLHPDGSATLLHHGHGGPVWVSADYLARDIDLGYAATAHRAQGTTVDTAHVLVTDQDSRETVYVAATRARDGTTLYAITDDDRGEAPSPTPLDERHLLEQVLRRQSNRPSAIETIRQTQHQGTVRTRQPSELGPRISL